MDTSFTSVFLMEDWVVYHAPLFFPSIFMSIILSYIVCQYFAFHLLLIDIKNNFEDIRPNAPTFHFWYKQ